VGTEALTILSTIYASSDSRHKNAGPRKSDQVTLLTSMLKQIQKSEKSNIKVRIIGGGEEGEKKQQKKQTLLKLQRYTSHNYSDME